jgi:hypothetical protein
MLEKMPNMTNLIRASTVSCTSVVMVEAAFGAVCSAFKGSAMYDLADLMCPIHSMQTHQTSSFSPI